MSAAVAVRINMGQSETSSGFWGQPELTGAAYDFRSKLSDQASYQTYHTLDVVFEEQRQDGRGGLDDQI